MDEEKLRLLLSKPSGKIGFYYHDLSNGDRLEYNADLPLMAASVIKLTVMAEAFHQFNEALLDPQQLYTLREEDKLPSCGALNCMHAGLQVTYLDLVTLMIVLSDNTATNILIDLLGMDNINRMIKSIGLKGSRINRKLFMPELSRQGIENYVTAADMGMLLEKLLDRTLVSPEASHQMLDILSRQKLNGKLPFWLHSLDIRVAHKTGEDDGITNDVGIIWKDGAKVLCFLSNETDVPRTERVIQDLAAAVCGICAD